LLGAIGKIENRKGLWYGGFDNIASKIKGYK